MCTFTLLHHLCTHNTILTSPKHTRLCRKALVFGLRPSKDSVLASCWPLPTDTASPIPDLIHAYEFAPTACPNPDCRRTRSWECEPRCGGHEDEMMLHAMQELVSSVNGRAADLFAEIAEGVDEMISERVEEIEFPWLRDWVSRTDDERLEEEFFGEMKEAVRCVERMEFYLKWRGPRAAFREAAARMAECLNAVEVKLGLLGELVSLLDTEGLLDQGGLCGVGLRLRAVMEGGGGLREEVSSMDADPFADENVYEEVVSREVEDVVPPVLRGLGRWGDVDCSPPGETFFTEFPGFHTSPLRQTLTSSPAISHLDIGSPLMTPPGSVGPFVQLPYGIDDEESDSASTLPRFSYAFPQHHHKARADSSRPDLKEGEHQAPVLTYDPSQPRLFYDWARDIEGEEGDEMEDTSTPLTPESAKAPTEMHVRFRRRPSPLKLKRSNSRAVRQTLKTPYPDLDVEMSNGE